MAVTGVFFYLIAIFGTGKLLLNYAPISKPSLAWMTAVGVVTSLNYAWAVASYHYKRRRSSKEELPPVYPAPVPFLGSAVSLAWDFTSTRISLFGSEMYIFQDRETIEKLMKHPSLASPMSIIIMTLRFLFGMNEAGLAAYRADDSGPLAKPSPGSNPALAPENRIDYLLHQSFNRAFTGPGLAPTTQRFREAFSFRIQGLTGHNECVGIGSQWTHLRDFFEVFGKVAIGSLTQAVYGNLLLELHPDIVDNLWDYDDALPWLARGVPRILMPGPYRTREALRSKLKNWYVRARQDCSVSNMDPDRDWDPVWGSKLVRYLHQTLHDEHGTHDDDAMSSHDLALLWASNFNAVSAATLAAFHVFRDPSLLARLREELAMHFDPPSSFEHANPKLLLKLPLLSAVYAETLRLYVHVFFMSSAPHQDITVGKWRLPRGANAVVSTGITHTDNTHWNDQGGLAPLSEFWADRFIVRPGDVRSGPTKYGKAQAAGARVEEAFDKPYFSTEGLEGVWIPYGGESIKSSTSPHTEDDER
ncbi:hypothetical protein CJF30_00010750 [Rutstroemia sp. NJR-2017a BBW]|nr:hypothetical protein CJF30_00010750 [Rutstroemia sp. NJR-2017a BBW]